MKLDIWELSHIHTLNSALTFTVWLKILAKFAPIFNRIRRALNIECLKMVYYSLVYPILVYCTNVWTGMYKTLLNNVCLLRKGFVRAIYGAPRKPHTEEMFHNIGLRKI